MKNSPEEEGGKEENVIVDTTRDAWAPKGERGENYKGPWGELSYRIVTNVRNYIKI